MGSGDVEWIARWVPIYVALTAACCWLAVRVYGHGVMVVGPICLGIFALAVQWEKHRYPDD